VIHQVRVIFGDTDAMGIVYYANYLRYFESARSALLRSRGLPWREVTAQHDVQFPVIEVSCRYRRPARYEDLLDIDITIAELGYVRVRFEYQIRCAGELLVDGHTMHACVDAAGRPRRIPAELREALSAGA